MKKSLLILGLVVAGAFALVRWSADDGDVSDPGLAFNRIWLDQLPKKPKDTANVFAAVTKERIGLFQSGSQFKGSYEIFSHQSSGDELRILYLQTDEKEKVKVRAWRCKEQGMDYCLELKGSSRGVKRYHSQQGWEIGEATRPDQLLDRIASIGQPAN